jgi:sporulation protein YlmC with PRC-barrel domain
VKQELHVELLLGTKVLALNGRAIGRLEEIRTKVNRGHYYVSEFLVGTYAVFERLAAWSMGRMLLHVLGARKEEGYRIRWDQLDLSDPQRPRLICEIDELLTLTKEQYP